MKAIKKLFGLWWLYVNPLTTPGPFAGFALFILSIMFAVIILLPPLILLALPVFDIMGKGIRWWWTLWLGTV